jgi:hypothetical protein
MLEKVGIGREAPARPWRERPLPVEVSIDVVVPLETAYDRFTEFDEYAKFLSRGETVDERQDERITWRATDGDATAVITFHRLSDRLTRVMVTYDQEPKGLLGRTASMFRTSSRALTADLARLKAFAEMSEEEEAEPEQESEEHRARLRRDGRHDRAEERRMERRPER